MNSIPKGAAGIALLLTAAARAARTKRDLAVPAQPRSILPRRAVGRIGSSYPSPNAFGSGRAA